MQLTYAHKDTTVLKELEVCMQMHAHLEHILIKQVQPRQITVLNVHQDITVVLALLHLVMYALMLTIAIQVDGTLDAQAVTIA